MVDDVDMRNMMMEMLFLLLATVQLGGLGLCGLVTVTRLGSSVLWLHSCSVIRSSQLVPGVGVLTNIIKTVARTETKNQMKKKLKSNIQNCNCDSASSSKFHQLALLVALVASVAIRVTQRPSNCYILYYDH